MTTFAQTLEVTDFMYIIKYHAYKCMPKLKNNCALDFDDIVNEGVIAFYRIRKSFNRDTLKDFIPYLRKGLILTFSYFVRRSYRYISTVTVRPMTSGGDERSVYSEIAECKNIEQVDMDQFNKKEKNYIMWMLSPVTDLPAIDFAKLLAKKPNMCTVKKEHRNTVRNAMGIDLANERVLRKNIKAKLA